MADGLSRVDGINWIEVDGDVVVVDEISGDIHVLEGAAAALWQLLDGEPLDGFATLMVERFGITLEEAETGLRDAVELLNRAGIVEPTTLPP
jgi:Coenzyme PQQ synthesis protein D (PqqD)